MFSQINYYDVYALPVADKLALLNIVYKYQNLNNRIYFKNCLREAYS